MGEGDLRHWAHRAQATGERDGEWLALTGCLSCLKGTDGFLAGVRAFGPVWVRLYPLFSQASYFLEASDF
jgi:hypothetical protein